MLKDEKLLRMGFPQKQPGPATENFVLSSDEDRGVVATKAPEGKHPTVQKGTPLRSLAA